MCSVAAAGRPENDVQDALRLAVLGAAAGAAGTTALNAVTYLDMAVRGRPSSSTPEDTVEALSERTHLPVPGEGEVHDNRVAGLGPLTGLLAGVGVGALLGLSRAAGWRPSVLLGTVAATVGALVGTTQGRRLPAKDPERAARRLVHIPVGRFAEASEIAAAVAFLASDDASFITASTFLVDGGISAAYVTPV